MNTFLNFQMKNNCRQKKLFLNLKNRRINDEFKVKVFNSYLEMKHQ